MSNEDLNIKSARASCWVSLLILGGRPVSLVAVRCTIRPVLFTLSARVGCQYKVSKGRRARHGESGIAKNCLEKKKSVAIVILATAKGLEFLASDSQIRVSAQETEVKTCGERMLSPSPLCSPGLDMPKSHIISYWVIIKIWCINLGRNIFDQSVKNLVQEK